MQEKLEKYVFLIIFEKKNPFAMTKFETLGNNPSFKSRFQNAIQK